MGRGRARASHAANWGWVFSDTRCDPQMRQTRLAGGLWLEGADALSGRCYPCSDCPGWAHYSVENSLVGQSPSLPCPVGQSSLPCPVRQSLITTTNRTVPLITTPNRTVPLITTLNGTGPLITTPSGTGPLITTPNGTGPLIPTPSGTVPPLAHIPVLLPS